MPLIDYQTARADVALRGAVAEQQRPGHVRPSVAKSRLARAGLYSAASATTPARLTGWKIDLLGLVRLRQRITGAAPAAGVLGKNAMIDEVKDVT